MEQISEVVDHSEGDPEWEVAPTRINDVRVTPLLGGKTMRNRDVNRAAQYIWMYVRENCMNLDAFSCTERISYSLDMVLKECRKDLREARKDASRHQKQATSDRLKAAGLVKEVTLLNKRIKKLEKLEKLEEKPEGWIRKSDFKRGRKKGTKKRGSKS
jgi:hypothetical protein